MPADIVNGRLEFVNGTRQFKSIIKYQCNPGYVLVGRNELMCDVDQRWNGPPPRCEPIYCDEPQQIRYGGFSLSTNSTRFGTVVTYYCTSTRHELIGPKKITCLKDGSYNTGPPACRESLAKEKVRLPASIPRLPDTERPKYTKRRPVLNGNEDKGIRRPFAPGRQPFPRKPIAFSPESSRPQRPKIVNDRDEEVFSARPPMDNEIPDSANVQNSPAGANVPTPVENQSETRQAQLNLGGIIALGVFGGFVFLAAIITTIVILIRRKETIDDPTFRSSLGSEVDRENSEVVVASHAASGYKSDKKHHHRHHHHHKHRRDGEERGDRHSRQHRY